MKIVGIILVIFGLVDLVGSFMEFDLWGTIGVQLPETLWRISSIIEIALGSFLIKIGSNDTEAAEG